jgi:hypothetical protein
VALPARVYKAMRMKGNQWAKDQVKIFTAHNDKLGFDFDNATSQYCMDTAKQ